jgi:Mrp family chromosome partitioning ATPase
MHVLDTLLALGTRRVVEDSPLDVKATFAPSKALARIRDAQRSPAMESDKGRHIGQRLDPRTVLLQRQCLKMALNIFAPAQVRSLGYTSAIAGEGKTFLASSTAAALANQAHRPVVLVDCNWEHPSLHTLYNLPDAPGLAEWARGECELMEIRHQVTPMLTVIPAGMALGDTINLTRKLSAHSIISLLSDMNEVLIADMPAILTSSYGAQLAQELDAVTLVVRARTTWDSFVAEAHHELEGAQLDGVILNATQSRIPRWIQRML